MNDEIDNSEFDRMICAMLDDPNDGKEKEVYFYHSDLCGSRAQSQTSLSYAEMKKSVRSNLCGSRAQSQTNLSYAEMKQSVRSKHLGSASWKKERFGKPFASERAEEARSGILHITITYVQHIQYLPYGEPYINQHPFGYSERFTFTGKERDEETGYGYFGARYMDYTLMTSFISVDRYASKYPYISPYAYCAWNPIRLIDPNGDTIVYSGTPEQQAKLKGYVNQFQARLPQKYKQLQSSLNVYNVQFVEENDDGSGGSFMYDINTGNFNVNIKENREKTETNKYSDIEVLAHELKHAEQYENRQLGFLVIHSSGLVSGYAYDLYDEYEAAEQALLFSPEGISYKAVKDAHSFTLSKYGGHLHHKKIDVFMQNLIDLEKSEIKPTIDERNARDRSKTIVYNKRK